MIGYFCQNKNIVTLSCMFQNGCFKLSDEGCYKNELIEYNWLSYYSVITTEQLSIFSQTMQVTIIIMNFLLTDLIIFFDEHE